MAVSGVDGKGIGVADGFDGAEVAGPRGGVEIGLATSMVPLRGRPRVPHLPDTK
ncbi:hypothetical protein COCNU_10G009910 [Cocos nucifera]|uniref:Uncharacterized protein n=1 Tax=Cocos nucifera TaxID=13894 RepID=A0A8K0N8S0_COCNU|nr:hypothetical protein COCNU_10G009910 [Cocos nucifera]